MKNEERHAALAAALARRKAGDATALAKKNDSPIRKFK